jgi:hypothetical protein
MAVEKASMQQAMEEKRDLLVVERERLFRLALALAARAKEVDRELADCVAAGRAFGVHVALPDWQNVHKKGLEIEMERATGRLDWARPEQSLERFNNDHEFIWQILDHMGAYEARQWKGVPRIRVREMVLSRLDAAGEQGVKADAIRAYVEDYYPAGFHTKTVGMTLYRLSREGLAHRDGRVWRRVRQDRPLSDEERRPPPQ